MRRFKLGFANRTLGLRLPERNRAAGAKLRERLVETGLYRKSGHEHFNGSLVIPVHDAEGKVVEVYGRKITSKLRKGTALHLYLPGPHRGVWNLDALRTSKEIILCEALVDALTFWCAGYRNVTSAYGTNGFTDEMLEAFKAYGVEQVLDRLTTATRQARPRRAKLAEQARRRRHQLLSRALPARDGRQRLRGQGDAGGEIARRAAQIGRAHGRTGGNPRRKLLSQRTQCLPRSSPRKRALFL